MGLCSPLPLRLLGYGKPSPFYVRSLDLKKLSETLTLFSLVYLNMLYLLYCVSQGSWVRYPVWPHTFVSPSAFSRRAVVSYWRKYVHEVVVNRLGGLSLPRKSVVRLTDRPDMTLDVYRGRKTTIQPFILWVIFKPDINLTKSVKLIKICSPC